MNTEPFNTPKRKALYTAIFVGLMLGFSLMSKIFSGLFTGLGKFFNIYMLGQWFGEALSKTYMHTYMVAMIMLLGAIWIFVAARKGQYTDLDKYDEWYSERKFFVIVNTTYHVIAYTLPLIYFLIMPDRLLFERGQFINPMVAFFFSPQLFFYYLLQNPFLGYVVNVLLFSGFSNWLFMKKLK